MRIQPNRPVTRNTFDDGGRWNHGDLYPILSGTIAGASAPACVTSPHHPPARFLQYDAYHSWRPVCAFCALRRPVPEVCS